MCCIERERNTIHTGDKNRIVLDSNLKLFMFVLSQRRAMVNEFFCWKKNNKIGQNGQWSVVSMSFRTFLENLGNFKELSNIFGKFMGIFRKCWEI